MGHHSPDTVKLRRAQSPERAAATRPRSDETKGRNGSHVAPNANPIGAESGTSSFEWACDDQLIGLLHEMVESALTWEARRGLRSMGTEALATKCECFDGDV